MTSAPDRPGITAIQAAQPTGIFRPVARSWTIGTTGALLITMMIEQAARSFCAALDAGAWETLASLLSPGCEYLIRGDTSRGSEPIVASYREIDEWVHRSFDSVRYESRIEACSDREALITFRDRIAHGEHRLDFRCQQRITVDSEGRIERITHLDIRGEPEKAAQFNADCGVQRP